jgi:hypothetical protein
MGRGWPVRKKNAPQTRGVREVEKWGSGRLGLQTYLLHQQFEALALHLQ